MSLEEDILIEHFLRNQLSEKERSDFLESISNNHDFREKFLIEKQLFETLNEDEWSYASKIDLKELKEYNVLYDNNAERIKQVINKASAKYKNKKRVRKLMYFSGVAAALVTAVMINFYSNKNQITTTEIYTDYIHTHKLPSIVNRNTGKVDVDFVSAEKHFKNKIYREALIKFDIMLKADDGNSILYLYKAISHIELGEYFEAEMILNNLINSDLIDAEKGYWYKALLYLKTKELKKCREILYIIIDNSYFNYNKAKELMEKLTRYEN